MELSDINIEGMAPFGQEKTAEQCLLRAAWELKAAEVVRGKPLCEALLAAHERTAIVYLKLARKKNN